jgi:hypothetical protein
MGASGLSDDDDGKNDRLKWKLAESVRQRNNIFTASPLSSFLKFKTPPLPQVPSSIHRLVG